jgi:hypothetical protein
MAEEVLAITVVLKNGTEQQIQCTEEEYNRILTVDRFQTSLIKVEGYYDCYLNWDDVSFMTVTGIVEGDEYGAEDPASE